MNTRTPISRTDDLDVLSGIWILSCNDDNPIMTYRGIAHRLGLSDEYDVKAVVKNRPELFRHGILKSRLNIWKDQLRSGKNRPSWIVEIRDKAAQEKAIDDLGRDDIFRNQFRAQEAAPRCDVEIIDWGLQHIDRLRKAAAEEKESKSRKWTSIIIPLASLLVAAASIAGSVGIQWVSIKEQADLKRYEVGFKPKQEAYVAFANATWSALNYASDGEQANLRKQIALMDTAFFSIEPFLSQEVRQSFREKYGEFITSCDEYAKKGNEVRERDGQKFLAQAQEDSEKLRNFLYSSLFN
ncbi:hypothetical protein [Rhodoplanes sp. Z2-YC6860]|uniref:hypothetical protein n=1 Tax=Rhodoplanes sp. Z2-YC6860 TaxID=674703 RepID=UPI00078EEF97|nr:hypothetical protein [Rhodoplanes sp. Z2-YC6860]AMN44208.1 hypothetical protein RHPLAN_57940 [Rhodoplanes sp. Z2-YC6860]